MFLLAARQRPAGTGFPVLILVHTNGVSIVYRHAACFKNLPEPPSETSTRFP